MPLRIWIGTLAISCACATKPLPPVVEMPCFTESWNSKHDTGLLVQKGPSGEPVIQLARFRAVTGDDQGGIDFDLAALTNVGGELEGNSEARDYVLQMKSRGMSGASRVNYQGIYRLVETIGSPIAYEDLVDAQWSCALDQLWRESIALETACRNGTVGVMPKRGDDALRSVQRSQQDRLQQKAHCDPSGRLDWSNLWSYGGPGGTQNEIAVYMPSPNPLYPASDYFTQWRSPSAEAKEIKQAFQIYWLITRQRYKMSGRW